jgi:PAS domain S-box-containing protein
MENPIKRISLLVKNLGPVEQAQVVASTAVIVSMATIITAISVTGEPTRLMDFISILTVGTIGFTSVYFTLQYNRQLDEQRQQLLALNTIAEAVNRVVELDTVLQTALEKATELLNTPFGWIYMFEGNRLVLKSSKGTDIDFLFLNKETTPVTTWIHQPRVQRERISDNLDLIDPVLKQLGIQFWASIPLRAKDSVAGTMIVAGSDFDMFTSKQAELMEAFGNQISVALNNAQLFARVRQSEQKYIDLFENAPDIYLSVNRQHVITACNTHGAQILGYTRQEMVGKSFPELFTGDQQNDIREHLVRMFIEKRELKDVEGQVLRKDGERLFVNLNSTLLIDEQGSITTARVVARDISERKRMEAAILHAQKIDSIGSLAGGIAHDFNNILASILGSASIMRRRLTEKAKLSKYVEIIETAARRGSSLTRQLLTFARKTETATKSVNMNTLIQETLHMFERSVSKEIVVITNLATEVTAVKGDEGQIQQALLNLFLNARDAMPDGGTLSISTNVMMADATTTSQFTSVKPGPFVQVKITDTGVGIERGLQNRIFEPFFTTKDNGTGLGLSVVYGVVQGHGGFINLESTPGQGTTFYVYLPRVTTTVKAEARQRRQRLPRGRENVLVIDDEVSVCEIARDMLSDLGYTVYSVHDGKTGVETYRTRQAMIDVVLLDMNMPLMGGKVTFEQLKAINPNVRIIILTGYGKGVIESPTFSGEVSGFLQKPFQVEDLAMKVRQVLDEPTTAEPATL